jgi:hypothetical protein
VVSYAGGDGSSVEEAVVIRGARTTREGAAAEYAYLEQRHGPIGQGWFWETHSLVDAGGRTYDEIVIRLADGTVRSLYFDASESAGRSLGLPHLLAGLLGLLRTRRR